MARRQHPLEIAREGGRIGLVLGAGGATGVAFHAGTLLALSHDMDWSATSAAAMVGTSAGAITAALLRRRFEPADLCALLNTAYDQMSESARALNAPAPASIDVAAPTWRALGVRSLRSPVRLARLLQRGPITFAALGLLKDGPTDLQPYFSCLGETWPDEETHLVAVRTSDGRRVCFNQSSDVSFSAAVTASSAVPGAVRPVLIARSTFVDGGVASMTNVDVLSTLDLDAAFILSPLSGDTARSFPANRVRVDVRRRLQNELRLLDGLPVTVIEPQGVLSSSVLEDQPSSTVIASIVTESFIAAGQMFRRFALRQPRRDAMAR